MPSDNAETWYDLNTEGSPYPKTFWLEKSNKKRNNYAQRKNSVNSDILTMGRIISEKDLNSDKSSMNLDINVVIVDKNKDQRFRHFNNAGIYQ